MKTFTENTLATIYSQFTDSFRGKTTTIGTHTWAWVDSGSGTDTLVLLPGFLGIAESSFLYILNIANYHRVISISYPPSVGNVRELCDGLNALLDVIGIQEATLLGGSASGFIAQAFVRFFPGRVCGLILSHTGLPDQKRARTARFYKNILGIFPFGVVRHIMQASIYGYFPHNTPSHSFWRNHFRNVVKQQNLDGLQNRFALMDDFHRHSRFHPHDLSGWQGRILLMEMSKDRMTTKSEQAAMREMYPRAQVCVFSDADHHDSVEKPEEQIRIIMDFLDSTFSSPLPEIES